MQISMHTCIQITEHQIHQFLLIFAINKKIISMNKSVKVIKTITVFLIKVKNFYAWTQIFKVKIFLVKHL